MIKKLQAKLVLLSMAALLMILTLVIAGINIVNYRGVVQDAFRFRLCEEEEKINVIFLDCGRKLDAFRKFLFASVGISLIGYAAVLVLVVIFSNRIIRPIAESYEKQKRFITDAGHEIKTPLTIIHADD